MPTVRYLSQSLQKTIVKLARQKFNIKTADDIGMIVIDIRPNEYEKQGIKMTSHNIDFILFDHSLNKLGVLKRNQIKNQRETSNE